MLTNSGAFEIDKNNDRHGLKYISREKQPSMFQLMSWDHDPLKSNEWLVKMQPNYKEAKLTSPQVYEKPQKHEGSPNKFVLQHAKSQEKIKLKNHPVKHELYYYGDDQESPQKKTKTNAYQGNQKEREKKVKKEIKRLDQFNERQKKQIEIRKKNIKEFKLDTRELPNSAFTTYFGKPAFGSYGIGSDEKCITKHKSHSVMPHAGKNQPEDVQCHSGALNKANVINLETRVPKKPLENKPSQKCKVNVSQYYNVEIVKPDLINEVKFSQQDYALKPKDKTPSHKNLNYVPKRYYKPPLHVGSKNPKKKQIRSKTEEKGDGLSFMNQRDKFMKVVLQKKKEHNKLAYKPTECYPLDWDNQTSANSTARQDKWKDMRPAGVSSTQYMKANSAFLTE